MTIIDFICSKQNHQFIQDSAFSAAIGPLASPASPASAGASGRRNTLGHFGREPLSSSFSGAGRLGEGVWREAPEVLLGDGVISFLVLPFWTSMDWATNTIHSILQQTVSIKNMLHFDLDPWSKFQHALSTVSTTTTVKISGLASKLSKKTRRSLRLIMSQSSSCWSSAGVKPGKAVSSCDSVA